MSETSGTTSGSTMEIEKGTWERPHFLSIAEYVDEDYNEEINRYEFLITDYSGYVYRLCLKGSDIDRLILFKRKSDAETRYFKHLNEN